MAVLKELKLKARISNIEETKNKLKKFAKYSSREEIIDSFFASEETPKFEFRLRKSKNNKIFTFKIPISTESRIQENEEYEFKIDDGEDFIKFIEVLGFKPLSIIRKSSESYNYKKIKINLSEIEAIGHFIELKIHSESNFQDKNKEELLNILKKLGIPEENIDTRYYGIIKEEFDKSH